MKGINIILTGAPGSGKGTLARMLSERMGFAIVSMGDSLRKESESGSQLGETLKPLIGTGGLVPDELVTTVLATELKKAIALEKGVLFDGFPRNLSQIHILEKIAIDAGCKIDSAIYLSLNEAKAVERIQRRALKENREDDQNLLVITKRMNEFREKTVPVIRRYEELGILLKFDGSGTPEEVYTMVSEKLLELSKND